MTTAQDAETAVRNYLLFLEDPSKLIDPDEVRQLESQLQASSDPLDKLRVVSKLHQIHNGDRETYRQAFAAHAKAWAEANDIPASSFIALGVDDATLRAAGFSVRAQGRATSARRGQPAPRHASVRVEQVKASIAKRSGEFTLADIASASGGSPMTIRKAVDELIAAGEVQRIGPTPNWSQPGRAPIQFRPITAKKARH